MVSGRTSTRGSASSMKWTAAELLDMVARRGVDGGRGYGEGVAAMASAMAGVSSSSPSHAPAMADATIAAPPS